MIKTLLKSLLFFWFITLTPCLSQLSDKFEDLNYRESVFTSDLKKVFVFRKENFGNVFVYDVVNNTMIKEIKVEKGSILKIEPRNKYFLIVGTEGLYYYDMKTLSRLTELEYNYVPKSNSAKNSNITLSNNQRTEASYSLPEWLRISIKIENNYLIANWDDGHCKVWEWKKKKLLHEFDYKKTEYGTGNGDIYIATKPTLFIKTELNEITIYDSLFNEKKFKKIGSENAYTLYNNQSKEISVIKTDVNISSGIITSTYENYDIDLNLLSTSESTSSFKGGSDNVQSTFIRFVGNYSLFLESEYYYEIDEIYKNEIPENSSLVLKDIKNGKEIYRVKGSLATISSDGKRMIVKNMGAPVPDYNPTRYKKFFKNRSNDMAKNRYYAKYVANLKSLMVHNVYDLDRFELIFTIKTGSRVYFYNQDYILENASKSGGLKLYDYATGKLVKEI